MVVLVATNCLSANTKLNEVFRWQHMGTPSLRAGPREKDLVEVPKPHHRPPRSSR